MSGERSLPEVVAQVARLLAPTQLLALADKVARLATAPSDSEAATLLDGVPRGARKRASALIGAWRAHPVYSGSAVALGLQACVAAAAQEPRAETQIVWTGPATPQVPVRRTDEALLQLIGRARKDLWIVAFAVHKVPLVMEALRRAADSGVALRLVVESAAESEGKLSFDQIRSFQRSLPACGTSIYVWPAEKRGRNDDGQPGVLHAKCAVADGRFLLVSSANLTEFALTLNMELGLLLEGDDVPRRVASHLAALVDRGVLELAQEP